MLFELERITRLVEDLKRYSLSEPVPITALKTKDGAYEANGTIPTDDLESFPTGELWGGYDKSRWFFAQITIEGALSSFTGKQLILRFTTGREGEWDALNPQAMIYVNQRLTQGVDINHREIILTKNAAAGDCFDVAILFYSGLHERKFLLTAELMSLDADTEALFYDMSVPLQAAKLLAPDDLNRIRILRELSTAADLLDFRDVTSEQYRGSIRLARALLKEKLYTTINSDLPTVTAIGHTHIDIAWLWRVCQTKEKTVRSFATVLALMEQYPEYKFMSSQPILYQFIKEQEPVLYEQIKARIKEGRWEVDGAMWLEADCNIPSGESFVRQLLAGYRFFKEEFGIESTCLWLPDVFGYSAALPQILKKSGIHSFMTTKISWNQFNTIPNDTFLWEGIDGSEVFTYFVTTSDYKKCEGEGITFSDKRNTTTYTGILAPNQVMGTFDRYQNKDINENTLMLFGYGDGGGGPTREMLENSKRLKYGFPGCPRVEIEFGGRFIESLRQSLDHEKLPRWVGELYLEYHRGTYTSMAKNKWYNRKCEIMCADLEGLNVVNSFWGQPGDKSVLKRCWDVILLNQFHDIIPGSSIRQVYEDSWREYEEIMRIGGQAVASGLRCLASNMNLPSDSIVVYNPLGFHRSDIVYVESDNRGIRGVKSGEVLLPVQHVENGILFLGDSIPSKGAKAFPVVYDEPLDIRPRTVVTETKNGVSVSGPFFEAQFDALFQITSLYDKRNQRQILTSDKKGNELVAYEDRPMDWENWDLDIFYKKKPYAVDSMFSWELVEQGPVRTTLRVAKKFLDSEIIQWIHFYDDAARIDFDTEIDWHQKNIVLKVYFPIDVLASKATFDIQYGNYERPTHQNTSWDVARFETCAHKWIDVSENGYGVALLNDSKYGFDVQGSVLGMTMLKSGTYPNAEADVGHHRFMYSIYPHCNDVRNSDTIEESLKFNTPAYGVICKAHKGVLPAEFSFAGVNADNCCIEVIKPAEDGRGVIIRVYECKNRRANVEMRLYYKPEAVWECDLMERDGAEVAVEDNGCLFTLKPFEIKTFRVLFEEMHYGEARTAGRK